jgi:hypothetical protein
MFLLISYLPTYIYIVAFENQINTMEGPGSYENLIMYPRNRSESITALSDIMRGVRSDSLVDFAEAFRSRGDSMSDTSMFLPLLLDSTSCLQNEYPARGSFEVVTFESADVKTEVKIIHEGRDGDKYRFTLQTPVVEVFSTDTRVGAYSREERQVRINRFRDKKKKRVWRKQIKYDCRKRLADTRPRIKGRFVSRKEDGTEMGPNDDLSDCIDVLTSDK